MRPRGGTALSPICPCFLDSEEDFRRFHRRLKLTPCPQCMRFGTLIFNGTLSGYAEDHPSRKDRRGQRVLCNPRKTRNPDCGYSTCVWFAHTIRRSRLGAQRLWAFLAAVVALRNKAMALRQANADLSPSSAYRIWNRFLLAQSHIRTALNALCPAPDRPRAQHPAEQTLAHLQAAFPLAPCPLSAFQARLQISVL